MTQVRRLAAILAADVAGCSRLMGADEEGTHERLKTLRHELVDPKIAEHHGRIVNTTGDGVNIAARIEALADAGGVFVSNTVHEQVRDRLPFVFEDLGEQQVKNIARPVRVYRVGPRASGPQAAGTAAILPPLPLPDKPSIAVLPFANMSGDP